MTLININSQILPISSTSISIENRAFKYGDSIFETIKLIGEDIIFWEDHYFRLMASMRIMRMNIPINFSPDFLKNEIIKLVNSLSLNEKISRVRLSVFRESGGYYEPSSNEVSFIIEAKELKQDKRHKNYEVNLFKEHKISSEILSTLKTNNRAIQIIASIYKKENDLDNCIMINEKNNIVEAIDSNFFLVKGTQIYTPPISDGCIRGVMRKNLIDIIKKSIKFEIKETSISPFEILRADEVFLSNVIKGIQPVNKYRKVNFKTDIAEELIDKVNTKYNMV